MRRQNFFLSFFDGIKHKFSIMLEDETYWIVLYSLFFSDVPFFLRQKRAFISNGNKTPHRMIQTRIVLFEYASFHQWRVHRIVCSFGQGPGPSGTHGDNTQTVIVIIQLYMNAWASNMSFYENFTHTNFFLESYISSFSVLGRRKEGWWWWCWWRWHNARWDSRSAYLYCVLNTCCFVIFKSSPLMTNLPCVHLYAFYYCLENR